MLGATAISEFQMFMQIYIFIKTSEKMKRKWRFVSPMQCYNKYYTSDILCIFAYYIHWMHFYPLNSSLKYGMRKYVRVL